jgi:hypothetical protein
MASSSSPFANPNKLQTISNPVSENSLRTSHLSSFRQLYYLLQHQIIILRSEMQFVKRIHRMAHSLTNNNPYPVEQSRLLQVLFVLINQYQHKINIHLKRFGLIIPKHNYHLKFNFLRRLKMNLQHLVVVVVVFNNNHQFYRRS